MMLSKKSIGERLPSDVEVDAEPIDPVEYYKGEQIFKINPISLFD